MPRFRTETTVGAPVQRVWDFHADVANLIAVIPMNRRPHVLRLHEGFEPGCEFVLRLGIGYWHIHWHGRIVEADPPRRFVDEMLSGGPFSTFRHEHRFEPLPDRGARIIDTIDYLPVWGALGQLADWALLRWQLRALFGFRRRALSRLLRG